MEIYNAKYGDKVEKEVKKKAITRVNKKDKDLSSTDEEDHNKASKTRIAKEKEKSNAKDKSNA